MALCRYAERNPAAAGLKKRAQDWRWRSLWVRLNGTKAPAQRKKRTAGDAIETRSVPVSFPGKGKFFSVYGISGLLQLND
jgi:hypothetical protein